MVNSSAAPCVESTLSVELSSFELSTGIFVVLLAVCVSNCFLSFLAVLENGLVLVVIVKYRELHTNPNILIFTLALTDLLVGLVVQPAFVTYIASKLRLQFNCQALIVYLYAEIVCVGLSLLTLSLICCERYFAVLHPFKYVTIVTKSAVMKTAGIVWFLWFTFNVVSRALKVKNDEFFSPVASVIIGASLILNGVLYFRIYRVIRQHEQQTLAQKQVQLELRNTERPNAVSSVSRESKMARTVSYIAVLLVLCYTPLMITSIADVLLPSDAIFDHMIYPLAETATFMNSCVNPLLYCWRCQDIRDKMKVELGSLKRRLTRANLAAGSSDTLPLPA